MKKLAMTVLTAAIALPLTFAAQAPKSSDTTSTDTTTTTTTKTKKHHTKKSHAKKSKTDNTTAAPAATK